MKFSIYLYRRVFVMISSWVYLFILELSVGKLLAFSMQYCCVYFGCLGIPEVYYSFINNFNFVVFAIDSCLSHRFAHTDRYFKASVPLYKYDLSGEETRQSIYHVLTMETDYIKGWLWTSSFLYNWRCILPKQAWQVLKRHFKIPFF